MNPRLHINAFRCAVAGVLFVFCWVRAAPALALTQKELDWCLGKNASPDLRADSCTVAIQSGKLSKSDLAVAFYNRALAHVARSDYEDAFADFGEAIRLNPQSAVPYNDRGFTYVQKGDFDRAIADYNEAIRLDPRYILALRNRGFAYWRKREYDRAIADFDIAIGIDPNDMLAYNDRGVVYKAKGDLDRAIADFDKAVQLNPRFWFSIRQPRFCVWGEGRLRSRHRRLERGDPSRP
jgi:tetratricopeptide (TPR) repeat protein